MGACLGEGVGRAAQESGRDTPTPLLSEGLLCDISHEENFPGLSKNRKGNAHFQSPTIARLGPQGLSPTGPPSASPACAVLPTRRAFLGAWGAHTTLPELTAALHLCTQTGPFAMAESMWLEHTRDPVIPVFTQPLPTGSDGLLGRHGPGPLKSLEAQVQGPAWPHRTGDSGLSPL